MSDINTLRAMLFARCPEFSTTDTSKLTIIDTYIQDSQLDIDSFIFGNKTDRAITYLTAHRLTLSNPLSLDDTLLKNKVGGISKDRKKWDKVEKETWFGSTSQKSNSNIPNQYQGSVYGLMFWELKQSVSSINVFLV